ncbi:MAG: alpha/beta hydrolase [Gammaproteobacteria bacterium]|nr:alpha/beta hydrolase [Gammaproteobacteria bacterium]MYF37945.1 alpha/beta hydrolase [Gammaproteobacteria bacterium]
MPYKRTTHFGAVLILLATSWLANAQENKGVEILEDVIYGHKAGMALIYDVFKPEEPNGTALIFMVSYGWRSPWQPAEQKQEMFQEYLDRNITVFNVYHGSSPQFKVPDAVADVRRAVRHIRVHAEEYAVDDQKFVAWGYSAGGHLSLMLALASDSGDPRARDPVERASNQIAAAMAIFPPVDLTDFVGPSDRFPALDFEPALAESVSPIFAVSEDDPPILLVHGDQDRLVDIEHSERIRDALKNEEVPVHLEVIEGAGHGFYEEAYHNQYQKAVFKFLEENEFVEEQ